MMTTAQFNAFDVANNGAIFAGYNINKRGSRVMVYASTLKSMKHHGWVTLGISPDGGMMATITDAGFRAYERMLALPTYEWSKR